MKNLNFTCTCGISSIAVKSLSSKVKSQLATSSSTTPPLRRNFSDQAKMLFVSLIEILILIKTTSCNSIRCSLYISGVNILQ